MYRKNETKIFDNTVLPPRLVKMSIGRRIHTRRLVLYITRYNRTSFANMRGSHHSALADIDWVPILRAAVHRKYIQRLCHRPTARISVPATSSFFFLQFILLSLSFSPFLAFPSSCVPNTLIRPQNFTPSGGRQINPRHHPAPCPPIRSLFSRARATRVLILHVYNIYNEPGGQHYETNIKT